MKKRVLLVLLIGAVVAAGIIAGRTRAHRQNRRTTLPAATIISRVTEYGENGDVLGTMMIIRRQYSDGTWRQHGENQGNGKPFESSGRVEPSHVPTAEEYARVAAELGRPEDQFLGYRVYIQKDERAEVWYAPELDAVLKLIAYDRAGRLDSVTEAISITPGNPQ